MRSEFRVTQVGAVEAQVPKRPFQGFVNTHPFVTYVLMASKPYSLFVAGYDLANLAGTDFFHTSVVLCPAAARLSREAVQDSQKLHESLEREGCEEMIFDRKEHGIWSNRNLGRWSLEDNERMMVHWRHAGEVQLPGTTAVKATEALKEWAANSENFSAGTYNLFSHNCNSFTSAVLRKTGFDPEQVLACGRFRNASKQVPCLAPEASLSPETHRRFFTFL